jgi:D-serine dehydratase
MCIESVHDGVHDLLGERRRVRELRLGVVTGLHDKLLALQQLSLDDVVDIDELVIVSEIALQRVLSSNCAERTLAAERS